MPFTRVSHRSLLHIVAALPTDYQPWGTVDRDALAEADQSAADCSCGCRWYLQVEGRLGLDWGVCAKPAGPRQGLLTFEHQAGHGCFERE